MNTLKAKELLALDTQYILATAIAVWLPVFLMYWKELARPDYYITTLLFGTGYMLLVRMLTAFILLRAAARKDEG